MNDKKIDSLLSECRIRTESIKDNDNSISYSLKLSKIATEHHINANNSRCTIASKTKTIEN